MAIEQTRQELEAEIAELKRKLATLESATVELRICAAPFAKWHGISDKCEALRHAMKIVGVALKDIATTPGHVDRLRALGARAQDEKLDLKTLADAADEARREEPGYRADLEA
ncbi:MAG: hypothetical protein RH946_00645 [Rhodospirillales bacterium]